MKKILITQRVDYISSHEEQRDALDQRWISLMLAAKFLPVPVANNLHCVKFMLEHDHFDGLLLTGGNSLVAFDGNSSARDDVECYLLEWAIRYRKPVLGVCRGMQLIQQYYQIPLEPVPDHIGVQKHFEVVADDKIAQMYRSLKSVSVFHRVGCYLSQPPLKTIAKTAENVIMAIRHEALPVYGVMWHPEREERSREKHIEYLKFILDS